MKKTDTNSIRYPSAIDEKLEKLSKGFGRTKKELFCQMVEYFYRSKKDPADWSDEILKKQLSSGINRILSFIRQQEKDFLLPVFSDTSILKAAAAKEIKLLEGLGILLLSESKKSKQLFEQIEYLNKSMKVFLSQQEEKKILKERFSEILEYYIHQREEMGWTTTAVKKEELINHVRKSLSNL